MVEGVACAIGGTNFTAPAIVIRGLPIHCRKSFKKLLLNLLCCPQARQRIPGRTGVTGSILRRFRTKRPHGRQQLIRYRTERNDRPCISRQRSLQVYATKKLLLRSALPLGLLYSSNSSAYQRENCTIPNLSP